MKSTWPPRTPRAPRTGRPATNPAPSVGLTSTRHVPLAKRSAPAIFVELDDKDVVPLLGLLGTGGVLEITAPSVHDRHVSVDGDRCVTCFECAGGVRILQPRRDDGLPADHRLVVRMVGIGRILGEEVADGV